MNKIYCFIRRNFQAEPVIYEIVSTDTNQVVEFGGAKTIFNLLGGDWDIDSVVVYDKATKKWSVE